jgi:hypothetical protein
VANSRDNFGMVLALITLTVAQLFDLGTFVRMVVGHGPSVEANPLVRYLLTDYGLPTLVVAKVAVLSLVVAVVAHLAGRAAQPEHRRLVATVLAAAIVAGLVGGWSNATVML